MKRIAGRLQGYFEDLFQDVGRRERQEALWAYLQGLLLDGERKSMVPMASRLVEAPEETGAMRQRFRKAVCRAEWDDATVYERIARKLDAAAHLDALVLDDTGFPKQGEHSVGVQRQYSGTLGKKGNCQVATSLHVVSTSVSACIGMQLYLPKDWARDCERRESAGVPGDVEFREKWRIGIELLDRSLEWVSARTVLADAGYGDAAEFRTALAERGLLYVVGVNGSHLVWPPCSKPAIPENKGGLGRPRTVHRDTGSPPKKICDLAKGLSFRTVTWREGTKGRLRGRFAAVRVCSAHNWTRSKPPGEEQWLLVEETGQEKRPYKYFFSNLPASISTKKLVGTAKLRWRIEHDYKEMKDHLGLDHFEGRGWRGFHHHATCVAAAHAFLALERALFPPESPNQPA